MKYNSRGTQAIIDLSALKQNYKNISKLSPNSETIAVIKANAYGHGSIDIAKALQNDVPAFAVAFIEEAITLRNAGITCPILILEGPLKESDLHLNEKNGFWFVFHSKYQTDWLLKQDKGDIKNVWIKVNTGMNRLGFMANKIDLVIQNLTKEQRENLTLCSHFSNAEDYLNKKTPQQIHSLKELSDLYQCSFSIANSAGILNWPKSHGDYNRLGIALYGISPLKEETNIPLIPVMTLQSSIIAIHHLNTGDSVGYGGIWQAKRPSTIATIAIGYADGYPRSAKNGTPVWLNNQIAPLVGRVSMDMITIDVTEISDVVIGDLVELWGNNIAVETVADNAETINYELLTQVSERVPKIYTHDTST